MYISTTREVLKMIEYTVKVYGNGSIYWLNKEGQQHCEHGPAVEKASGFTAYYLNHKVLTKKEWEKRLKNPCREKVVEIDGVKYKLVEV